MKPNLKPFADVYSVNADEFVKANSANPLIFPELQSALVGAMQYDDSKGICSIYDAEIACELLMKEHGCTLKQAEDELKRLEVFDWGGFKPVFFWREKE